MPTQTNVTQRGSLADRIVIESDVSPIADDFDLDFLNLDVLRNVQIGVKMLTAGGAPAVATSGDFDVALKIPNLNVAQISAPAISASAPATKVLQLGIEGLTVTPNTIVAGTVTQYQVVVTLYP